MEDRFVLLSANDPSDVEWTLSLLHFAKYAGIGRVLQMRGVLDTGPRLREISRECRATRVRLDVLGDRTQAELEMERARDGSFTLADGIHAWKSGTSVIWGGKQVTLLGSPTAIADTTLQDLAEHSPAGADIVIRGLDLERTMADSDGLDAREHTWRLLRQLRPLLYVSATVGSRQDSVEALDGRTLVQCGLPTSGSASVAVLDLRSLQVLS